MNAETKLQSKHIMSDTPETQEAVERWRQGKINIFDEMARLERERDQWREIARIAVAARDHNRAMWDKCAAELDEILKSYK